MFCARFRREKLFKHNQNNNNNKDFRVRVYILYIYIYYDIRAERTKSIVKMWNNTLPLSRNGHKKCICIILLFNIMQYILRRFLTK